MRLTQKELNTLEMMHDMRDDNARQAIGDAVASVLAAFDRRGFAALNDDRLAAVEAAVAHYFFMSNPEHDPARGGQE